MGIIQSIFLFLRAFILGRAAVAFENLCSRLRLPSDAFNLNSSRLSAIPLW